MQSTVTAVVVFASDDRSQLQEVIAQAEQHGFGVHLNNEAASNEAPYRLVVRAADDRSGDVLQTLQHLAGVVDVAHKRE
jgi:hypothetical protein